MGINITLIMINGSQRMALSQRGYFVFVKRASGSCLPSRQLRKEFSGNMIVPLWSLSHCN